MSALLNSSSNLNVASMSFTQVKIQKLDQNRENVASEAVKYNKVQTSFPPTLGECQDRHIFDAYVFRHQTVVLALQFLQRQYLLKHLSLILVAVVCACTVRGYLSAPCRTPSTSPPRRRVRMHSSRCDDTSPVSTPALPRESHSPFDSQHYTHIRLLFPAERHYFSTMVSMPLTIGQENCLSLSRPSTA